MDARMRSDYAQCFIATAAMGSELHPHVNFLRSFRDDVVLKSNSKNAFTAMLNIYYTFSPFIAEAMERNDLLKSIIKLGIVYPFIYFIKGWVLAFKDLQHLRSRCL